MDPLSYKRPTPLTRFYYGSPYYPEHWDAATRAKDPDRMAAAHWNCVRMAEFAWDLIEPEEGAFDFALFDETVHKLGQKGIYAILCTPTATPPRWLSFAHPEILKVDASGAAMQHGSRQQACYSSTVLRDYSRKITRALAEHYRDNPYVAGWQTDNEINCHLPECHCTCSQEDFRRFLREKYQDDIGALNHAWGTAFWAQTYTAFEQIETPRPSRPSHPNPAAMLDYYRFLSWSVANFQHDQVELLRAANPEWFITHNGTFRHIDYRGLFTRDLDFLGYDSYPHFNHSPSQRRFTQSFNLDQVRAWSGNFFLMEQQSGPGGQSDYLHDTPEPGEMRRMAYTSIARGADSLLFFRWRTARFGAEEYWCGILDHDNISRRRYQEAQQLGEELSRVGPAVLGTHVFCNIAVAGADSDVVDAFASQTLGLPSPEQIAQGVHRFFESQGYAVGVVHPADDLSDLVVYVIPHWALFDPAWVPNLTEFVAQGGVLVVGARTATKDLHNNVIDQTPPGCLRDLVGATVEEFGKQNAPDEKPLWIYFQSEQCQTRHWYELLKPDPGTQVIATWEGRHLGGQPAATLHGVGQGAVIYAGCYLTEDILESLFIEVTKHREVAKLWPFAPEGVEVVKRQNQENEVWFFINHSNEDAALSTVPEGTDLITGKYSESPLTLKPNGVAVIESSRKATPGI